MVHSEADYNAAVEASGILFGNATSEALKKLDEDTLLSVFEGVPQFEVAKSDIEAGIKAVDLFTEKAAIFPSKGEMRKLVQGGGVSLNKEKLAAFDQEITTADLLDEKYLLVQRGKKKLLSGNCQVNSFRKNTGRLSQFNLGQPFLCLTVPSITLYPTARVKLPVLSGQYCSTP